MNFQKIYTALCRKSGHLPFGTHTLLALMAGGLTTFALAPYFILPCAFIGLSLFYVLLSTTRAGFKAFITGWLFGFGYFTAGLWWIANALLVEGNPYAWVYPLAVAGLPALLAIFTAFSAYVIKKYAALNTVHGLTLFILITALSEWLRGHILTGFPWNLYGHIWINTLPLAQVAAVCGVYGLSLLTVFWAVTPGFLLHKSATRRSKIAVALIAGMSLAASYAYGAKRLQTPSTGTHDNIHISIIQPNIAQEDKWNPEKTGDNIQKTISISRQALETLPVLPDTTEKRALLIWPETALSKNVYEHPVIQQELKSLLAKTKREYTPYLMTGYLRYEKDEGNTQQTHYYNSLAVFDESLSARFIYNKSHLVPFGEYIPLQDKLPFLKPFVQLAGFTAGTGPVSGSFDGIPPFRPLVCYEIIFPSLSAPHKNTDDQSPAWILNVTNDGWYGDSPGPYQHLAQSRFRAIEQGRPVVRAANTGISGLIDPYGRVIQSAGLFEDAAISSPLPLPLAMPPLYSRLGEWTFAALSLLTAVAFALFKRKAP